MIKTGENSIGSMGSIDMVDHASDIFFMVDHLYNVVPPFDSVQLPYKWLNYGLYWWYSYSIHGVL